MKKIILSLIVTTQIIFASSNKPKEYTVEEMLNKFGSSSEKFENIKKNNDFEYISPYLSDFDKKQKEMIKKLYLVYMHRLYTNSEKYKQMTDQILSSVDKIKEIRSKGKYIILKDENNNQLKALNNIRYYIDIKNEKLYSNEMEHFSNNEFNNLYSMIYQAEFNRVLIFEPKNTKTSYFSIINLGKQKSFTFQDLKETIKVYMEKKEQAEIKEGK